MTTTTGFTPNELELMVKEELRKKHPVPDALLIRIVRHQGSWRAEVSFKNGHGLIGEFKADLAARVEAIGSDLAPTHALVG
jgi:hypothetical protein